MRQVAEVASIKRSPKKSRKEALSPPSYGRGITKSTPRTKRGEAGNALRTWGSGWKKFVAVGKGGGTPPCISRACASYVRRSRSGLPVPPAVRTVPCSGG